MKVAVVGGSGDLGTALSAALLERGHEVVWLSRDPERTRARADALGVSGVVRFDQEDETGPWAAALGHADAVALLAGSPISDRWTPRTRGRIVASRVDLTRRVVAACEHVRREAGLEGREPRPATLVSISGVGVYGDRGDDILAESEPPGSDWLAQVAALWEEQAMRAVALGMRVVVLRTGLVLDDRGLLPKLLQPMRLFAGGPVGSGSQWLPWIHRDDAVAGFVRVVEDAEMRGVYNNVAPGVVRMSEFTSALGATIGRPSWARVPTPVLRVVVGAGAPSMVMSQRPDPARLLATGFEYRYPTLQAALDDLLGTGAGTQTDI